MKCPRISGGISAAQAGNTAMALKKTLTIGTLFALLASGGFAGLADAQQSRLGTPSATFEHRAVELPENTAPLATPGVFNYDAQAFAPFEFANDKEKDPNTGFFFTIDKTFTHVSRSDRNGTSRTDVPVGGDWNWGERYQLGYVTKEDAGWTASYQRTEGTYYQGAALDEPLRFIGFTPVTGLTNAGEQQDGFGPRLVDFGDMSFDGEQNLQVTFGTADSFTNQFHIGELNRVFRQALKNGDTFEPYIGGRFTNVNDASRQDTVLQQLNDDGTGDPLLDQVGHRFRQTVSNNAIGLQLGGRHVRRRGRWTISTDGSLSTSYNQQRYTTTDIFFIDAERNEIVESFVEENSFVPTLDLDLGFSFNITRDITIRGGAQFIYLWQGIARVNTLPAELNPNSFASDPDVRVNQFLSFPDTMLFEGANSPPDIGQAGLFDDSYIATGITFGVEWKR